MGIGEYGMDVFEERYYSDAPDANVVTSFRVIALDEAGIETLETRQAIWQAFADTSRLAWQTGTPAMLELRSRDSWMPVGTFHADQSVEFAVGFLAAVDHWDETGELPI
jgi:hypothetical protein